MTEGAGNGIFFFASKRDLGIDGRELQVAADVVASVRVDELGDACLSHVAFAKANAVGRVHLRVCIQITHTLSSERSATRTPPATTQNNNKKKKSKREIMPSIVHTHSSRASEQTRIPECRR